MVARSLKSIVTVAALSLGLVATAPVAVAQASAPVGEVISSAQEQVGIRTELRVSMNSSRTGDVATPEGELNVAADQLGNLALEQGDTGSSLVIPDAAPATLREEEGMAVASSAQSREVDYGVAAFSDGSVKVHSVIKGPEAPERFDYEFPGVDEIILDEATGMAFLFSVVEGEWTLVGGVDIPWAVDAQGTPVPTHYEALGNRLTQVVEHRAGDFAYPVTADPSWWDNVKGWFKNAGSFVASKAESAANWLKHDSKWLAGKTWAGIKNYGPKVGKFAVKKIGPWSWAVCAVGGGWAWYRSDADGWVRVGDAVAGCFL